VAASIIGAAEAFGNHTRITSSPRTACSSNRCARNHIARAGHDVSNGFDPSRSTAADTSSRSRRRVARATSAGVS
jgi:hypothetical protein